MHSKIPNPASTIEKYNLVLVLYCNSHSLGLYHL
jgi:hypothetical protein